MLSAGASFLPPAMTDLAILTAQQYRDMAMRRPRYGPLSCSDPRQHRSLALPYVSLHTHILTPRC